MNALIITDVQYDFLPGRPLGVPFGDQVIPVINKMQSFFQLVVATQDWHPANHVSFASNHSGHKVFDHISVHGFDQILWPDHCVQGSHGARLSDALDQHLIEAIFRKGMDKNIDSYSAFFDNEHQKATGLGDFLRGRGVTKVYLSGLAGDFCVGFSALDAIELGFETWLIEDAVRSIDDKGFAAMKKKISLKGGRIIQSSEVPHGLLVHA